MCGSEALSDEFDHKLLADREEVDLVIVMGTSMRVRPPSFSALLPFPPDSVPLPSRRSLPSPSSPRTSHTRSRKSSSTATP